MGVSIYRINSIPVKADVIAIQVVELINQDRCRKNKKNADDQLQDDGDSGETILCPSALACFWRQVLLNASSHEIPHGKKSEENR